MTDKFRHRRRATGAGLLSLGLILTVLGLFPGSAGATDDLDGFNDKGYNVTGNRDYNPVTDQTTFTFNLTATGDDPDPSHVLIVPCIPATVISATGPAGSGTPSTGTDASTGHSGTKFDPGKIGTYTIVYDGNLGSADFVVKNGSGHKHFTVGSPPCEPVDDTTTTTEGTTTTTVATTTTETPTTTEAPTTTAVTPTTVAAPVVLGEQITTTSTTVKVLGVQQTRQLAATGDSTRPLLLLAGFLLALGGTALLAGRQPQVALAGEGMRAPTLARLLTLARMALTIEGHQHRRRS